MSVHGVGYRFDRVSDSAFLNSSSLLAAKIVIRIRIKGITQYRFLKWSCSGRSRIFLRFKSIPCAVLLMMIPFERNRVTEGDGFG